MHVRLSADWMVLADERILEILSAEGGGSPQSLADDDRIQYGRQHVQNRLTLLLETGLVERIGRGVYRISEEGEAYLAGEFDARDLPEPE